MSNAGAPARRLRIGAGIAAAVFGALAVGSIAAPLLQLSGTQSSTTTLRDGTVTAPGLGAVSQPPPDDVAPLADPGPVAVAAGIAARSDGSAVLLTTFAGGARTDARVTVDDEVLGLAVSPEGDLLAVVDATGSLSLFTIDATVTPAGTATGIDIGSAARVEVATSSDGSAVAVSIAGDELVRLYDRASGAVRGVRVGVPIAELAPGPASTVHALTDTSSIGERAPGAAPTEPAPTETAIVVLDAAGASVVRAVAAPTEGRSGIALVGGGASVAVWDEERLLLLDAQTLDASASYEPADPVFAVADGPAEGTIMIAIGGSAPRIALVDLESGLTLSEIGSDVASFAAIGAAGAPASLFLATPRGIAVGSWDASRVAWQAWWTTAAAFAVLAIACAIVALTAGRTRLRAEPAMGAIAGPGRPTVDTDVAPMVEAPPSPPHPLDVVGSRPVAVSGSVDDRMHALRFAVVAPAPVERVLAVVLAEAGSAGTGSTSITVDAVSDGPTVLGSVVSSGVRMAAFVVSLTPASDGGTHTRFRVDWYRTAPAMVPFTPGDREESVSYPPLRDFAMALTDALERVQP